MCVPSAASNLRNVACIAQIHRSHLMWLPGLKILQLSAHSVKIGKQTCFLYICLSAQKCLESQNYAAFIQFVGMALSFTKAEKDLTK